MIRRRSVFSTAAFACLLYLNGDGSPHCFPSTGGWHGEFGVTGPWECVRGQDKTGSVSLRFDGASLSDFIQAVGPLFGISAIQIDPQVKGTVTMAATGSISREAARKLFDRILFENQTVIRKSGASYRASRRVATGDEGTGAVKTVQRQPVSVAGNIQASRLIHRVEPVYPELALRARVSATTLLEVTINEEGDVSLVRIIRSGHPLLQLAAVDAVKQWRYSPACIDGELAPVITTVAVTFTLPGPAKDEEAPKPPAGAPLHVTAKQQATRLVYAVEPEYSEAARKEHILGTAWMEVTVDESGRVSAAKFLCGSPLVEQAMTDAVKQWRYAPTEMNGSPLTVTTLVQIPFDLRSP